VLTIPLFIVILPNKKGSGFLKKSEEKIVAKTAVVLIADGCKDNLLASAWEKIKSRHLVRVISIKKIEGRIVNFRRGYIQDDKRHPGYIRVIDFFCVKSTHLSSFPSAFSGVYNGLSESPPSVFLVAGRPFVANALIKHNWVDRTVDGENQRKFINLGDECLAKKAFFFSKDNACLDEDVSKILQALERQVP
jgi:hypothetical protein